MNRKRLLAGLTGVVTATVLAASACSSSSSSTAANSSAKPVPLVVYSAQGYDKAETTAFTKATGIPVKLDDNSTGPLLTQIEASKNNPNWGLLWVDGDTAFATLDSAGMLLKGFEPGVSWSALGSRVVPADKSYVPTGITLAGAIAYNKSKVKAPASWAQLTGSQWKGKVGMDDPSQSGPTFPLIAGVMNSLGSVSAGEKYFTQLKSNGVVIHPTNGPTLQALTSGQINVALVQSSAAVGAAESSKNIGVEYLKPVTVLPSAIGIDAHAPAQVQAEAKKFADFVLSPAGQKVMQSGDPTGDSLYYPTVSGVTPLKALPPLPTSVTQHIDPYKWGPQEGTINNWFDANIVR